MPTKPRTVPALLTVLAVVTTLAACRTPALETTPEAVTQTPPQTQAQERVMHGAGPDEVGLVPNDGDVPDQLSQDVLVVTNVVDGDTVDVSSGERVRLVGIDTPEEGEPCYQEAGDVLRNLVLDHEVTLTRMGTDRYDRTLGYIDVNPGIFDFDPVPDLLVDGLAVPRYNSTDGYGAHPREEEYAQFAAEATTPACGQPALTPEAPAPVPVPEVPAVPVPDPVPAPPPAPKDDGGDYPGYTGPRCYAPGGKTWKPCPEKG
ncbi:thermonuclease family protein [Oerskovia sp. NPDC060338]|uniref:thermonuclease family protein n=1 Tax=Oerskovia sp. NPDC060338 TaxID=3347100 RepID=UPI003661279A